MDEYEGDYSCEVREDSRCGAIATRVVREPYTPGRFMVLCCDEHAAGLIDSGYHPDKEADKKLAEDKKREAEMMEKQL